MDEFRIAVKALIVDQGKALLLKRRKDDVHKPDSWDIPGGRLDVGENPFDGLKREALEEAGIDIDIVMPIDVNHFVRDDGQKITMIIFLCYPKSTNIQVSHEHQEYIWADVVTEKDRFPDWLTKVLENLSKIKN